MVNPVSFMVCTTRMSPMTVMAVVEVVGVMPSTHTSCGFPVLRHTLDSCARGLSGFPVDDDELQSRVQVMCQLCQLHDFASFARIGDK